MNTSPLLRITTGELSVYKGGDHLFGHHKTHPHHRVTIVGTRARNVTANYQSEEPETLVGDRAVETCFVDLLVERSVGFALAIIIELPSADFLHKLTEANNLTKPFGPKHSKIINEDRVKISRSELKDLKRTTILETHLRGKRISRGTTTRL
ncbi:hypothetical protein DBV15_01632 [Temnothorax longispinosus]|uniref:Uncharacterized protein n=1 Tax=Temnothorax longispinosus TaxID=300112 RepID=A0A4S2L0T4_9HYME|nr:hypothetical protein DBV15_01632 [Temnothorax longispinosus]